MTSLNLPVAVALVVVVGCSLFLKQWLHTQKVKKSAVTEMSIDVPNTAKPFEPHLNPETKDTEEDVILALATGIYYQTSALPTVTATAEDDTAATVAYVHCIDATERERLFAQAMSHRVLAQEAHGALRAYLQQRRGDDDAAPIRVLVPYFGSGANARVLWRLGRECGLLERLVVRGVELRAGAYGDYADLRASVPGLDLHVIAGDATDTSWMVATFTSGSPWDVVYTTYGLEHTPAAAVGVLNTLYGLLRHDGSGLLHIAECSHSADELRSNLADVDAEFNRLVTELQVRQRAAGGNPNYGDEQFAEDVKRSMLATSAAEWSITPMRIAWETGTNEPFLHGMAFVISLFKSVGLDPAFLEDRLEGMQGFVQMQVYVLEAKT